MSPTSTIDVADVWLLVANRPGEIGQQRALGAALGVGVRELRVATLAPTGKSVAFDFAALRAPWPRLAISFGKTLPAALRLRELSGGRVRIVHLGLPRRVPAAAIDLVVPMPTDRYIDAPNVVRIAMPLGTVPAMDATSARRLRAAAWPRPWTALLIGGPTRRLHLGVGEILRIAAAANEQALAAGGSLLVSTSPRTPPEAAGPLRERLTAPGELYLFGRDDAGPNPYAAYVQLADELVVTGDSASMIAECWRSGKTLRIAALRERAPSRWMRRLRRGVPRPLLACGAIAGDVDLAGWIAGLVRSGRAGRLAGPAPAVPYRPGDDTDLARVAARVRALLDADAGAGG